MLNTNTVIPAKAGIHLAFLIAEALWIPAFAGMSGWPRATVVGNLCMRVTGPAASREFLAGRSYTIGKARRT
jgi:hypothetical protein